MDKWDELLAKGESQYQRDKNIKVKITAIKPYYDLEINRKLEIGDTAEVSKVRADYISEMGYARY